METWKNAMDRQLEELKPYFPITNTDAAVAFLKDQLESVEHLSFPAVCFFLNGLAEVTTVERKIPKRKSILDGLLVQASSTVRPEVLSETNSITWAAFCRPWRALRRELSEDERLSEALEEDKASPYHTKQVVKEIFRFIDERIPVSKDAQTSSVTPLSRFVARLDKIELKGKNISISSSEQKELAVLIAHLVALRNVHLSLSESEVFVRDGGLPNASMGSSGFIDVVPFSITTAKSGVELSPNNLWTYNGEHYIHCDTLAEVAYMVCKLREPDQKKPEVKKVQYLVLEFMYAKGHLTRCPAAIVVLAQLHSAHRAEELFREAIAVSREFYDDAFVLPYCRFAEHLLGHPRDYVLALVPAVLAARAVSVYHYIPALDRSIHDEIMKMADLFGEVCLKFHNDDRPADPLIAPLLLSFLDCICLWEQKNQSVIFHSTWSQKLVSLMNPSKLGTDMFRNIMIHGSAQSVSRVLNHKTSTESDGFYLEYMLDTFRENNGSHRKENVVMSVEVETETQEKFEFPENVEVNEEFCYFALDLYENWAPMRLDKSFLGQPSMYFEIPEDTKSEAYVEIIEQLRKFPVVRGVSGEDLARIAPIREVNPLYKLANKQVFPFLDMGPPNIAICSFDYEKVKREVKAPLPVYVESRVIFALHKKLNELTGKMKEPQRSFSHVVLRSNKMQSVKTMLSGERIALAEIKQVLEGSPISATNTQKRERRPTSRR